MFTRIVVAHTAAICDFCPSQPNKFNADNWICFNWARKDKHMEQFIVCIFWIAWRM